MTSPTNTTLCGCSLRAADSPASLSTTAQLAPSQKSGGNSNAGQLSKSSKKAERKKAEQQQPSIPDLPEVQGQSYFDTHTHLDQILPRVRLFYFDYFN
jgi:hypothetical protein